METKFRFFPLCSLLWKKRLFMFIVFVVASLSFPLVFVCACHREHSSEQWAARSSTQKKRTASSRKKRIMCLAANEGGEEESTEREWNLHTTPSFYSHLSAIFMLFCANPTLDAPRSKGFGVSFIYVWDELKLGIISNDSNQKIAVLRP